MKIRKLLILTVALGVVLAVAFFGGHGLKDLLNTTINPAQAADEAPAAAGSITVSTSGVATGMVGQNAQAVAVMQFLAAPELPTRMPEAAGLLTARDGNNLTLQSFFMISGEAELAGDGTLQIVPVDPAQQSGQLIVSGSAGTIAGGEGDLSETQVGAGTIVLNGESDLTVIPASGEAVVLSGETVIQGELPASGVVEAVQAGPETAILVGSGMPGQAEQKNVLVTGATQIYRDVTPMGELTSENTQATIQQVVETGSLEDLTGNVIVTVWGHMEGDQLVADVILYQTPIAFK